MSRGAKARARRYARRVAALRDGSVVGRCSSGLPRILDNRHGEIADASRHRSTSAFSFSHPVARIKIAGSFISASKRGEIAFG